MLSDDERRGQETVQEQGQEQEHKAGGEAARRSPRRTVESGELTDVVVFAVLGRAGDGHHSVAGQHALTSRRGGVGCAML